MAFAEPRKAAVAHPVRGLHGQPTPAQGSPALLDVGTPAPPTRAYRAAEAVIG